MSAATARRTVRHATTTCTSCVTAAKQRHTPHQSLSGPSAWPHGSGLPRFWREASCELSWGSLYMRIHFFPAVFKIFFMSLAFDWLTTCLGVGYFRSLFYLEFFEIFFNMQIKISSNLERFWPLFVQIFLFALCSLSSPGTHIFGMLEYVIMSHGSLMLCSLKKIF